MVKKFLWVIVALLIASIAIPFSGCAPRENNNIQTGEWNDDTFTNYWSGITFTLPPDIIAADTKTFESVPGEPKDLYLIRPDQGSNITLYYVDLIYKRLRYMTPEKYLNNLGEAIMKQELPSNTSFTRSGEFKSASIAGEEYLVMHMDILLEDLALYQDIYVRKFDNAMIVFMISYNDNSKDAIESFVSSIESVDYSESSAKPEPIQPEADQEKDSNLMDTSALMQMVIDANQGHLDSANEENDDLKIYMSFEGETLVFTYKYVEYVEDAELVKSVMDEEIKSMEVDFKPMVSTLKTLGLKNPAVELRFVNNDDTELVKYEIK